MLEVLKLYYAFGATPPPLGISCYATEPSHTAFHLLVGVPYRQSMPFQTFFAEDRASSMRGYNTTYIDIKYIYCTNILTYIKYKYICILYISIYKVQIY